MSARQTYVARINRVIDHIDAHLAEPLSLKSLAEVAHFSPWHFHRLFQAFTGETLADRVRRRRLEVAAVRLLAQPPDTVLSIALDVGFASPEVFTRTFNAHFGATPSGWRRGAWRDWAEKRRSELGKIRQAQRKPHQAIEKAFGDDAIARQSSHAAQPKGSNMNVDLETFPDLRVAYMRQVGPYGDPTISALWQRFMAWSGARGSKGAYYGISHDSPDITAPEQCRYDACVEVEVSFAPAGEVGVQTIPGGLYACTRFSGTPDRIHAAWMRLYAEWLPESGYQADDRPAFEAYGNPIDGDAKTGAFVCRLCLPVRV